MIDLHSHVLPGLDDGPRTMTESLEQARLLVEAGVHTVAATPHVREDFPTEVSTIERAVLDLQGAAKKAQISLRVLNGAELAFEQLERPADELRGFGLGGNPNLLLVEAP